MALEVAVVVLEVVQLVVLRLSLNHIDTLVFSLQEVRKIYLLLRMLLLVNLSMVKRESLLKNLLMIHQFLQLRLNTEFGILSDLSLLQVLWVV